MGEDGGPRRRAVTRWGRRGQDLRLITTYGPPRIAIGDKVQDLDFFGDWGVAEALCDVATSKATVGQARMA